MKVSVIVPYHKNFVNSNLIDELNKQTMEEFEVILLNSEDTESFEKPKLLKNDGNIKSYSCGNPVSFKRNEGVKIAKSDYIIFIDDDCILPDTWLQEMYDIKEDNRIVSGNTIYDNPYKYDKLITYVPTCNLIMKKSKFIPFDHHWKYAAFEDTAWGHELYIKGIPSVIKQQGILYHPQHKRFRKIKKRFLYGMERMKYQKLYHSKDFKWYRAVVSECIDIMAGIVFLYGFLHGFIKYWILKRK